MARLGNILIAAAEAGTPTNIERALVGFDVNVDVVRHDASFRDAARDLSSDLIIVEHHSAPAALALAEGIKDQSLQVIVSAGSFKPVDYDRALEIGVADLLAQDIDPLELSARLRPLLRLTTQNREALRRNELAARFDGVAAVPPDLSIDDDPRAIVYIGRDDKDRERINEALGDRGGIVGSADLFTAAQWLSETAFDACVLGLDPEEDAEGYLRFCDQIRHNPNLYNLPIILIDSASQTGPAGYRHGATEVIRGLPTPEALRFSLVTHCDRQRRRRAIRNSIEAAKRPSILDSCTLAYSSEFLREHLETLIAAAEERQKYLSVISLAFPSLASVRQHFGLEAGDRLMRQIAEWIRLLIRVEDMTAAVGDHGFFIALPSVPPEEARLVMARIAGILSHTDFAIRDVYQPIAVDVEFGLAEVTMGDTADALMARARDLTD